MMLIVVVLGVDIFGAVLGRTQERTEIIELVKPLSTAFFYGTEEIKFRYTKIDP